MFLYVYYDFYKKKLKGLLHVSRLKFFIRKKLLIK